MADVSPPHRDNLLTAVRHLEPLIRAHADEAERNRRLSTAVVTAMADAGIFRMYTPHTLGGLEVDPLTFYQVVEAIARIDGSTGWCVFIAGGNPLLGAYLTDHAANATRSAAAAVDLVYTAAGATANYRHSPFQRALRDIHAATQHMGTSPQQFESAGRMLVGLLPLQSLILV
jgi:alkylation response protein AidB-like acyl-CoA dehydrogenase